MKGAINYIVTYIFAFIIIMGCAFAPLCQQRLDGTYYLVSMHGTYNDVYYDVVPGINYYSQRSGYGGDSNLGSEILILKDFVTVEFYDKFYVINIAYEEAFIGGYTQEKKDIKVEYGDEEIRWKLKGNKIEIQVHGLNIVVAKKTGLYQMIYK